MRRHRVRICFDRLISTQWRFNYGEGLFATPERDRSRMFDFATDRTISKGRFRIMQKQDRRLWRRIFGRRNMNRMPSCRFSRGECAILYVGWAGILHKSAARLLRPHARAARGRKEDGIHLRRSTPS